jgi:hypothetical protein
MVVFSGRHSRWENAQVAGHAQMDDEHFACFEADLQKFCSTFNRSDYLVDHFPLHDFHRNRVTQSFTVTVNAGDGPANQERTDAPANNFNFG